NQPYAVHRRVLSFLGLIGGIASAFAAARYSKTSPRMTLPVRAAGGAAAQRIRCPWSVAGGSARSSREAASGKEPQEGAKHGRLHLYRYRQNARPLPATADPDRRRSGTGLPA